MNVETGSIHRLVIGTDSSNTRWLVPPSIAIFPVVVRPIVGPVVVEFNLGVQLFWCSVRVVQVDQFSRSFVTWLNKPVLLGLDQWMVIVASIIVNNGCRLGFMLYRCD